MKIKILFLISFTLIFSQNFAQSWFEDDAVWIFNRQTINPYPTHGYVKFSVAKDTVINDTLAKVIKIETFEFNGITEPTRYSYVRDSLSKVYYWNGKKFKLMYDFNLKKGDTLNIEVSLKDCDSVTPITIDSVTTIIIEGKNYKVQYYSYSTYLEGFYNFNYNDKIIEFVGNVRNFIYNPECNISESFAFTELRCFENSEFSYTNPQWKSMFPSVECDTLINLKTSLKEPVNQKRKFITSLNPAAQDHITLSKTDNDCNTYIYKLLSSKGELLFTTKCNEKVIEINTSSFPRGIVILNVYDDERIVKSDKILITNKR